MSGNQRELGWGRKLRRARNVVKRFEREFKDKSRGQMSEAQNEAWDEGVIRGRYDRAVAILLAEKLRAS